MKYKGTVVSGLGVARERVQQNLEVYEQATGMTLVAGTLNVRLTRDFKVPLQAIHIPADKILPADRKRGVTLVAARMCGEDVALMCPDRPIYEKNVVEIMASFNIRDRFGLKDGDEIEIEMAS